MENTNLPENQQQMSAEDKKILMNALSAFEAAERRLRQVKADEKAAQEAKRNAEHLARTIMINNGCTGYKTPTATFSLRNDTNVTVSEDDKYRLVEWARRYNEHLITSTVSKNTLKAYVKDLLNMQVIQWNASKDGLAGDLTGKVPDFLIVQPYCKVVATLTGDKTPKTEGGYEF